MKIRSILGEQDVVLYLTTNIDNCLLEISSGRTEIQLQMFSLNLSPGRYTARIYLRQGVFSFDIIESFRFVVETAEVMSQCLFYQPRTWHTIKLN